MGWSAGGHLALLYAYKERRCRQSGNNCDGCALENSCNNIVVGVGQHPIKLVISEAGPTNFLIKDDNGNSIPAIQNICNLVGITENDSNTNDKLFSASPIKYVTVEEGEDAVDVPYTILAYGSGISCGSMGDGDGTVLYSQATSLVEELDSTFGATSDGSGTNTSQIIEGANYTLVKLYEVGHNTFGEGNGKVVYPNVEIGEEDDAEKRALKAVIQNYYDKISTELQKLNTQENN